MYNMLFLTTLSPFPPHSGERIRARYLLKALEALDCRVTAIIGNEDGEDLAQYETESLKLIGIPGLQSGRWKQSRVAPFFVWHSEVMRAFNRALRSDAFDGVILEYGYLGPYLARCLMHGLPVIYDSHNVDSRDTLQRPVQGGVKKTRQRMRAAVQAWHERYMLRRSNAVIIAAQTDHAYWAPLLRPEKTFLLPNFLDLSEFPLAEVNGVQPNIVVTANFRNFTNYEAGRWLLREVWNDELAARATLQLVGWDSDVVLRELGEGRRGVEAFGHVPDSMVYLKNAACAAVPLNHGTGQRLKCLEAMAVGTPLVCTTLGADSIEHKGTIQVADDPEGFRAAILRILDDKDHARKLREGARQVVEQGYSLTGVLDQLNAALECGFQDRRGSSA